MTAGKNSNTLIFLLCGLLHAIWGAMLLVWPIQNVSAVANVCGAMQPFPAAIMMLAVGIAAMCSTLVTNRYVSFALIVSQQAILIMSGVSAIQLTIEGCYPDGTVVSHAHLFADTVAYSLLAIFHTAAIVQTHGEELLEWLN